MAMYYSHSQSPNPPVCHVEELDGERETAVQRDKRFFDHVFISFRSVETEGVCWTQTDL